MLHPRCLRCRSCRGCRSRALPADASRPGPALWERRTAPVATLPLHAAPQTQPAHRQPRLCWPGCRAGRPRRQQGPLPAAARCASHPPTDGCARGAAAAPGPAGWRRLRCAQGCSRWMSLAAGLDAAHASLRAPPRPGYQGERERGAARQLLHCCQLCRGCWCGPDAARQAGSGGLPPCWATAVLLGLPAGQQQGRWQPCLLAVQLNLGWVESQGQHRQTEAAPLPLQGARQRCLCCLSGNRC